MNKPRLPILVRAIAVMLTFTPAAPAQNSQRATPPPSTPPPVPAGVTAHRDVAYVTNAHQRQKLDLYVPEKGDGPFPIIVWIHGGAWMSGDKNGCPPLSSGFVARGYAGVSLDYRLSGDAIFPAQIEDCKAAIRWLRAHAKEYRLDPTRIGVWGASAGGHLVALLGTSGDSQEFDVGENLDQSSRVQAVSDFGWTFRSACAHAVQAQGFTLHKIRYSSHGRVFPAKAISFGVTTRS